MAHYTLDVVYRGRELVEARLSKAMPDGQRDVRIAGDWTEAARQLGEAGHTVEVRIQSAPRPPVRVGRMGCEAQPG